MTQQLIIQTKHIPDLNKYIHQERTSRYAASKIKREWTEIVKMLALAHKLKPMESPVMVSIAFHVKNKKRDKDNLLINTKFILDGLVAAGVLKNDGWDDISHIIFNWFIDKEDERMEVMLAGEMSL